MKRKTLKIAVFILNVNLTVYLSAVQRWALTSAHLTYGFMPPLQKYFTRICRSSWEESVLLTKSRRSPFIATHGLHRVVAEFIQGIPAFPNCSCRQMGKCSISVLLATGLGTREIVCQGIFFLNDNTLTKYITKYTYTKINKDFQRSTKFSCPVFLVYQHGHFYR